VTAGEPPPGYERVTVGAAELVALRPHVAAAREALRSGGTLYDYAAHHPEARVLSGRGVAYAVPLPDSATCVVVRRSRHGGLLAPLTGDRFVGRTRAPHELAASLRLRRADVPTPELVAYATYPAGRLLRRADVATREIPGGRDLAALLTGESAAEGKRQWLDATALLLHRLARAGVRHPDLNLKNVLIARDENGQCEALLLDVDRVWFDEPGAARAAAANFRRLARSARKWRARFGAAIDERDLERLAAAAAP
jgi:hypothetical protein